MLHSILQKANNITLSIRRHIVQAVLLSWITVCVVGFSLDTNAQVNLPALGDASSSVISPQQEYELGQTWLRLYRSRVPTSSDPLLQTYLEQLLTKLALHSPLRDKNLELIVVKNPTMNAFAVPGGIVGVHTGLFLYAESEGQLSSVLTHELAHLSQRHYARSLERQQKNTIPTMAALLGGLVLAATTGSDAGLAAIATTQAVAMDSMLRFSRQNEQEADRIGMQTLIDAGEDPYAAPAMFERMLQATRYSQRPPEFLLTHPVTENRIADALNRASKQPRRQYAENLDFFLMRVRAQIIHEKTPQHAVQRYTSELNGESLSREASQYGLVIALTDSNQLAEARANLRTLRQRHPEHPAFVIAEANIEAADNNLPKALSILASRLESYPNHHAFNVRYAELLIQAGQHETAKEVLQQRAEQRPKDDQIWYLLAEANGLAGDILGVHEARAEYFVLNGVFDKAQLQLRNALKLAKGNYMKTALLEEKLKQVTQMQEDKKF